MTPEVSGPGAYTAAAVSKAQRERVADWLMTVAAPILLLSLFLTWSHQFTPAFAAAYRGTGLLTGVPRDPDAWQVYSTADVLLGLVAGGLLVVALWGGRARRLTLAVAVAVALAFTVHAISVPPTNGAVAFEATAQRYAANAPAAGPGETVALCALVLGAAGVALSYTVDP